MSVDTGPPGLAARAVPAVTVALALTAAVGVAVLSAVAPLAPVALLAGGTLLVAAAVHQQFGLTATLVVALLVPLQLSIQVGPSTLSPGRALLFGFLAGWVASLSRPDGPRLRATALDPFLVGLVVVSVASLLASSPTLDATGISEGVRTLLTLIVDQVLFLYAAVSVLGSGRRHLDRVLRIGAGVVAATAALGVVELATQRNVFDLAAGALPPGPGDYVRALATAATEPRGVLARRVQATFPGPNQFGTATLLAVPLLVHYAVVAPSRRWWWAAAAFLTVTVSLFTASRSVFVVLLVVLATYLLGVRSPSMRRRQTQILAGLAVVIALALAASPGLRATMELYFRGLVGLEERSAEARAQDYRNVLAQVERTPVLGSGPGTWAPRALVRSDRVDPDDPAETVIDNEYLGVLAETGLAGVIATFGWLWGAVAVGVFGLRRTDGAERSLRAALLASVTGFAVESFLFDTFAFYGPLKLYLVVVAATMVAAGATRPLAAAGAQERTSMETTASQGNGGTSEPPGSQERPDVPQFDHLGRMLWRHKLLIVAILTVALGGGYAATVLQPIEYRASQLLLIDQPRLLAGAAEGHATSEKLANLIPTYALIASSDAVLADARSRLEPGAPTLEQLRRSLVARRVEQTLAIRLSVTADSAAEAKRWIEAITTSFAEELETRQRASGVAANLILEVTSLEQVDPDRVERNIARNLVLAAIAGFALAFAAAVVLELARR